MPVNALEERVEKLENQSKGHDSRLSQIEDMLMKVVYLQHKNEMNIAILQQEMKDFKDEMKDFKDEMRDFKDEMRIWRDEVDKERKEMNRKWEDLARKMGTIVEDIVAPGLPFAVQKTFGLDIDDLIIRRRKKIKNGKVREYEVIAVAGDKVFIIDVKSTYRTGYFDDFEKALKEFKEFFPEYNSFRLIGVVASLSLPEEIINTATRRGLLALNLSGDYLEFVNADKVNI